MTEFQDTICHFRTKDNGINKDHMGGEYIMDDRFCSNARHFL